MLLFVLITYLTDFNIFIVYFKVLVYFKNQQNLYSDWNLRSFSSFLILTEDPDMEDMEDSNPLTCSLTFPRPQRTSIKTGISYQV